MTNDLKVLVVGVMTLLTVRVTDAQMAETYSLPRPANCCLLNTATTLAEQLQDWNQLGRYHEANKELMTRPVDPGRGGGPTPRPRIQSVQRPPADLLKFNAWLKRYAAEKGAVYADYYTATVDAQGFLREGYTNDGLHPNAQGYTLMTPVASAAIAEALKR